MANENEHEFIQIETLEEWRSIAAYDNYLISNLGQVKNVKTGKILKGSVTPSWYTRVGLTKDGKMKLMFVNRLVADAFLDKPETQKEVKHIDKNRQNNRADNLRWKIENYHSDD
jgi:hypothetical protein